MALQACLPANTIPKNTFCLLANFAPTKCGGSPIIWGGRVASFSFFNSVTTALQARLPASTQQDIIRPLANFPPSIWDHRFPSFSFNNSEFASYTRQVEVLKEKVEDMLMASTNDPMEKINLINSLFRLGLSYHFENEIEEQLGQIFDAQTTLVDDNGYDLYTVAILFQVLRQYGYKISCDVFNKFKESDGTFKETLTSDVKGMLSLYEASHLTLHGEDILDEALAFTTAHLKSLANQSSPHLKKRIIDALYRPFHKGMPRLEARQYISFYEKDESHDEMLLKFAKLEFNRVQLLHQQELSQISSWWNDLNMASKLSYGRNRLVELYFWAVAVYFEPHYGRGRIIFTKILTVLSYIDDTYDAYGTLEELERFTDAVQRWDIGALDQLPDYMKILYRAMLNLIDELVKEMEKEGRSYSVSYAKEEIIELVRAYQVEAEWCNEGYVPPLDEYMVPAFITGGIPVLVTSIFIGMEGIAGIEAFEWVQSRPKILTASGTIARLIGDIPTHEAEENRGQLASSITCYMKQYGVSKKEAIEEIQRMIENLLKTMNEECMKPTSVSIHILIRFVNLIRLGDVCYKYNDSYTHTEGLKDYITALLIEKIPM